VTAAAL